MIRTTQTSPSTTVMLAEGATSKSMMAHAIELIDEQQATFPSQAVAMLVVSSSVVSSCIVSSAAVAVTVATPVVEEVMAWR